MTDLHISKRLKALLPALTSEERQQLKANIEADGRVTDPLLYWNDGKRNVIVDGMNRWAIIKDTAIPYTSIALKFGSYEEAEIWILDHQLGQRNLLKPAAIRKVRGQLYNRLKGQQGGDHTSQEAKGQNVPLLGTAASQVATKAGVSEKTVKRDGARVAAIEGLTKPAQKVAEGATDAEVKTLAKLDETGQNAVARAVRTGQAGSVKEAVKVTGVKPPRKYGKCPNCGGNEWDEDDEGVSCSKCHHPHGEPVGDPDEDRLKTQRQKTVKTVEALMRAFDDLNEMWARPEHTGPTKWTAEEVDTTLKDMGVISACKGLLKIARGWK